MDRGNFFHAVYRIEQKLGRVFRELEPYPAIPARRIFQRPIQVDAAAHSLPSKREDDR